MTHRRAMLAVTLALAFAGCGRRVVDLGGGDTAIGLGLGPETSCFLDDGAVVCAGPGDRGQLARDPGSLPHDCGGRPCDPTGASLELGVAREVDAGKDFVCARLDAEVRCVGANDVGQLGRGGDDPDVHATPLPVLGLGATRSLALGRHHACAVTEAGGVRCWGLGNHGELGVDPSALDECGTASTTALADELGLALGETIRCASSPVDVPGVSGVELVRAGPFATCAGTVGAGFTCFGRGEDGRLGVVGGGAAITAPTALSVPKAVDVALGLRHGCAVDVEGALRCFGSHAEGQLGLGGGAPDVCGSGPCALAPALVIDVPGAVAVVAGDVHTCALDDDGAVFCFGSDELGQVGDSGPSDASCGAIPCATLPSAIEKSPPMPPVDALDAAGGHTCARAFGRDVYCWGDDRLGQCGSFPLGTLHFPSLVYVL